MELGALGEVAGAVAVAVTLIYLAIQVRQARRESEVAVLESRGSAVRDLYLGIAASDGLSAAITKAQRATGDENPFAEALVARGLDEQEAERVFRWVFTLYRLHLTQHRIITEPSQREENDTILRVAWSTGLLRLFLNTWLVGRTGPAGEFAAHVGGLLEANGDGAPERSVPLST